MNPHPGSRVRVALTVALLLLPARAFSQPAPASADRLRFVLILSRHGVRSPTWTNARLNEYSLQPWPTWPVAPDMLTPHGKRLMTLFGQDDRVSLAEQGLLTSNRCASMNEVFLDAHTDQSTIESARGLADGLFPGCNLPVHTVPPGTGDPLFHSPGRADTADATLALAAIAGRMAVTPPRSCLPTNNPSKPCSRSCYPARPHRPALLRRASCASPPHRPSPPARQAAPSI